jgi:hypothetical protein
MKKCASRPKDRADIGYVYLRQGRSAYIDNSSMRRRVWKRKYNYRVEDE